MSETTSSNVADALIYSLLNAPIRPYPFPHFIAEDVFPDDYYADIQRHLPTDPDFVPIEETGRVKAPDGFRSDRFVVPLDGANMDPLPKKLQPFWESLADILCGQHLGGALLSKFDPYLKARFGENLGSTSFSNDILLIRDRGDYALGPHSDAPHRVLVLIIYLPETDAHRDLGTSVYVPKEQGFQCPGGPHYPFDKFHRVFTAPYVPNSAFGFLKTANSFHGVEPLPDKDLRRNLIHFFIRHG